MATPIDNIVNEATQIEFVKKLYNLHIKLTINEEGATSQDLNEFLTLNKDTFILKNEKGETLLKRILNKIFQTNRVIPTPAEKEIVMLLARAGADITETTDDFFGGETFLHLLVKGNTNGVNNELIQELVTLNKDILGIKDDKDRTPVHCLLEANQNVNIDIFEKLLTEKNIHFTDKDGATLLHAACLSGNLEVVKYLVNKGLSLTALTKKNNTVLHYAAKSENMDLFKKLIYQNKIDINIKNDDGQTALDRLDFIDRLTIEDYIANGKTSLKPNSIPEANLPTYVSQSDEKLIGKIDEVLKTETDQQTTSLVPEQPIEPSTEKVTSPKNMKSDETDNKKLTHIVDTLISNIQNKTNRSLTPAFGKTKIKLLVDCQTWLNKNETNQDEASTQRMVLILKAICDIKRNPLNLFFSTFLARPHSSVEFENELDALLPKYKCKEKYPERLDEKTNINELMKNVAEKFTATR